jgi:hypothetical protein
MALRNIQLVLRLAIGPDLHRTRLHEGHAQDMLHPT